MSRAVAIAAVLTPTLVSASLAQRRAAAEPGVVRHGSLPATRITAPALSQPQASPTTTGPDWSASAGIATGDNPFDIGLALGATAKWHRSDWPVGIRGDAYFAHHSGNVGSQFGGVDLSVNIFGVMGSAEYAFPTTNTLKPYAFAGLGLFYQSYNVDSDFSDYDAYDSSTDLGIGVGGGIHFTEKIGMEVRLMDIGGFTTLPIVAVFHF
jgi:hypothetical protein